MERQPLRGGGLRAAGYDPERRVLEVELANGNLVEYTGVGREIARRFLASGAPWSYFRDNIAEEFTGIVVGRAAARGAASNPFE